MPSSPHCCHPGTGNHYIESQLRKMLQALQARAWPPLQFGSPNLSHPRIFVWCVASVVVCLTENLPDQDGSGTHPRQSGLGT